MWKLTGETVHVAVKMNPYEDPEEYEDFEREMAILADPEIEHPNIVIVYGIIKEGKTLNTIPWFNKHFISAYTLKAFCNSG